MVLGGNITEREFLNLGERSGDANESPVWRSSIAVPNANDEEVGFFREYGGPSYMAREMTPRECLGGGSSGKPSNTFFGEPSSDSLEHATIIPGLLGCIKMPRQGLVPKAGR
jgi:hypothetical protein